MENLEKRIYFRFNHLKVTPLPPGQNVICSWRILTLRRLRCVPEGYLLVVAVSIEQQHRLSSYSGGFEGDTPARTYPSGPKFSQFHAVFGHFGKNRMLAPPGGGHLLLRGVLDPLLSYINLTLRRQKRINVNSRRAALTQRDISMKTTAFSAAVTFMSNVENKLLKIPCQFVLPE